MKYLVTGGAGFIGSHIVERLLADGHEVRVLDDFSTGREVNLVPFADRIDLLRGTITDPATVERALDSVDGVFHQAAIPSVPRSVADPLRTHASIVDGTLTILEAMRRRKGGRLVLASSSSVYGETPTLPKTEEMAPAPLSPYAVAKLVAEHYTLVYSRLYEGVTTVALRYFNVFGPRQDPKSEYAAVIPRFITAALKGERPVIFGDGEQSRDFTYVQNVVEANLAAMNSGVSGAVMNVACGHPITLRGVIAALSEAMGTRIEAEHRPARRGDVKHSFASVARARDLVGFAARVDFTEGLRRTIEHLKSGAEERTA